MSRITIPLGLADRLLGERHPPRLDEATAGRLERGMRRLEPDPLFRRRLRGAVLNRYVAEREGLTRPPAPRRAMGGLGRAVLYASLVLAIGVTAVGTAAQDALPGDGLYAVKLQIERVRLQVAPPALRDDLAALALSERIEELEQLAAAGAWARVAQAVAFVVAAEELVLEVDAPAGQAAGEAQAINALEAVLETAPPSSQVGLQTAIQAVSGERPTAPGTTRWGAPSRTPTVGNVDHRAPGHRATGDGAGSAPQRPGRPTD